jgi:DNA-binding NtrC family response regulator
MKQTLLIADGNADLCDLCRRSFTERGYEVETSSDGLDCLKKLRQVTPAAFVLDLELRWGGGDGVLAWLREESLMPGIPVILTATAGFPLDLAEYDPPVVDYLPKPFALTALLESVRSAVAKRERREPSNLNRVPRYSELFIG